MHGLADLDDRGYFQRREIADEPHTITVRVEGGVVQQVEDVPLGVTVRVVDYDNDSDLDGAGEPCSIELHEGSAQ